MYERLKKLCKERGLNITKLCEEVTNSSGNLSTWKKGYMRSDYLALVAERLQCSTDYLLGRTDSPEISGSTYIKNNNNNVNQAINGDVNINTNTSEKDDKQLFDMIKSLNLVERSKIITQIDEMKNKK